ncbi:tRNA (5-methylaminomethyl-2-thiouridine)(34)-methyltransferase MnmD [soil metagenome]
MRHLITTSDGSHTLFVPELGEHYHSVHGAVQESTHIFIKYGLEALPAGEGPLYIFEMGLGTGLNLLLTALQRLDRLIYYVSVEAYPVTAEEAASLNYGSLFTDHPEAKKILNIIHTLPWNKPVELKPGLTIHKIHAKLAEVQWQNLPEFNLIYFDAFAPDAQPGLWTEEIFQTLYNQTQPGGILTTYCAKGIVRRALKAAGFVIEKLPGPPGKREMTRAGKSI